MTGTSTVSIVQCCHDCLPEQTYVDFVLHRTPASNHRYVSNIYLVKFVGIGTSEGKAHFRLISTNSTIQPIEFRFYNNSCFTSSYLRNLANDFYTAQDLAENQIMCRIQVL